MTVQKGAPASKPSATAVAWPTGPPVPLLLFCCVCLFFTPRILMGFRHVYFRKRAVKSGRERSDTAKGNRAILCPRFPDPSRRYFLLPPRLFPIALSAQVFPISSRRSHPVCFVPHPASGAFIPILIFHRSCRFPPQRAASWMQLDHVHLLNATAIVEETEILKTEEI